MQQAHFLFGADFVQHSHHSDDCQGYNKDAQIAGAHHRQGFQQQINTHAINLQSLL